MSRWQPVRNSGAMSPQTPHALSLILLQRGMANMIIGRAGRLPYNFRRERAAWARAGKINHR